MNTLLCAAVAALAGLIGGADRTAGFDARMYGALGDGHTKDTAAIQKAIDACAASGGGTVHIAPGTYISGSLHLRSHVTIRLDAGATLKGSKDLADYDPVEELGFKNDADRETSFFHHSLLWGEDLERVGIVGEGTIDSNWDSRRGPKAIALKRCRFVHIEDVHIVNIPNYAISLLGTDHVNIEGVTILNGFADGIDPDACRNVRISNCHIETWDDAIVPKASYSLGERRSTENITVTNCYLATACNAFKLGTESGGDFKRIALSNCVMAGLQGKRDAISGIAIESVDGSNIDGIVVSNVSMVNVRAPVFIRLGNRGRDMQTPVPGTLRNVSIDNVVAANASLTCSVTGIPGHAVENISLSNIRIMFAGGGPYRPVSEAVPEMIDKYPDADMFEALPGYALYCRHVRGISLRDVELSYEDPFWRIPREQGATKIRPLAGAAVGAEPEGEVGNAIVCDDVQGVRISGLRAQPSKAGDAVIRLAAARDVLISSSVAMPGTTVFAEVVGQECRAIRLVGNALDMATTPYALIDTAEGAVAAVANTGSD